ncbi:hypothetical protein ACU063_01510 [Paenibacillus sp. M.A.Huq-81]
MRLSGFESKFNNFLEEQKKTASPRRLEMLEKDIHGTLVLFKEVLWPVFHEFEGFVLEYEFQGESGTRMYVDVFYKPLSIAFECDGYGAHAENITRRRFNFEKQRIRTMQLLGYVYAPFSKDELDGYAHSCRKYVQQLMGKLAGEKENELTIYEKEVIRAGAMIQRPFRVSDICRCLKKKESFSRKVIKSLVEKGLVQPSSSNLYRNHEFIVVSDALQYIHREKLL